MHSIDYHRLEHNRNGAGSDKARSKSPFREHLGPPVIHVGSNDIGRNRKFLDVCIGQLFLKQLKQRSRVKQSTPRPRRSDYIPEEVQLPKHLYHLHRRESGREKRGDERTGTCPRHDIRPHSVFLQSLKGSAMGRSLGSSPAERDSKFILFPCHILKY